MGNVTKKLCKKQFFYLLFIIFKYGFGYWLLVVMVVMKRMLCYLIWVLLVIEMALSRTSRVAIIS
jgi:hypothetical protein